MIQRVLKFGTGDSVPKGAKYITTLIEKKKEIVAGTLTGRYYPIVQRLVWHYFLVDCNNQGKPLDKKRR